MERYEVIQSQFQFFVKDHKEKRWIATCTSKTDADSIVFIMNQFEKSKS